MLFPYEYEDIGIFKSALVCLLQMETQNLEDEIDY